MADFEVLAPGGHQHLIEEIGERLDLKADTDGYYSQLTAGLAENLIGRGDAVPAEYLYRTAGGTDDISDGIATIDCIKGNTLVWNQLSDNSLTSLTRNGITFTNNGDGSITANGTATAVVTFNSVEHAGITAQQNHVYLLRGCPTGGSVSAYYLQDPFMNQSPYIDFGNGRIFTNTSTSTRLLAQIYIANGATVENLVFRPQLFDLTAMFGAGNEPSTVAEFEAMFPEPYYPYSAPKLLNVDMRGVETVGFNQLDTDTGGAQYLGHYYIEGETYNYVKRENSNYDCYRVPVFPSTEYCISADSGTLGSIANKRHVDASGNFISGDVVGRNALYGVFTTPSAARYIEVSVPVGTTKKLCINLSWSGYRNGEYEEYWSAERPIDTSRFFPTGLKKAGDKADALYADHYDTVIGSVDLGTKTWVDFSSLGNPNTFRISALELLPKAGGLGNIYCAEYSNGSNGATLENMQICGAASSANVYIRNSSCNTTAEMKAALSGVILYYELATPTTTEIDPPLNLSYKVSDFGTEKVMVDETANAPQTAPVPMEVEYGLNAIDAIRRLPTNYIPRDELEPKLDEKADVDGYYSTMTVGAADNLTGRGDGVSSQYLYRTAGGDEDIADGVANIRSIKGQTLVWNQMNNNTASTNTLRGVTSTYNGDGTWTLNGTATENGARYPMSGLVLKQGHKYLVRGCPAGGSVDTYYINISGHQVDSGEGGIYTWGDGDVNTGTLRMFVKRGTTLTNSVWTPQLFDLTLMFEEGNEPSTVAEFEAMFPNTYYPYSEPTLLSVNMEGIETVGFNQWDEEWELGGFSATGEEAASSKRIRSKNYIPIFGGMNYCLSIDSRYNYSSWFALHFYDADKKWIINASRNSGVVYTAPDNARYFRFSTSDAWNGAQYSGGICINLSWSGYRNGEYEEHWKSQREIPAETYFPDGMRSAGSVADELTPSKAITRIGAVDLGTLTWLYDSNNQYFACTNLTTRAIGFSTLKCAKYETARSASTVNLPDKQIVGGNSSVTFYFKDSSYTDAATFKASLDGVLLYYALAEPTEVTIDPPLNLSYKVSDFGTEKVMVDEEADAPQSAPPVIQTAYGINATDTVRRLPTQYISHDSFQQFVTALQSAVGITVTETWDETDGRYEYTVTQTGE